MDTGIPNTQKKIGRLKSLIFLLSFFYFSTSFAFAQQLSGSYTIGVSADYPTFSDAVSALTSNGISGPVTFDVQTGTYTEQILLGAITGASETNTITFQSQSGIAEDVVIQYAATGTADNYVIRFDSGSHYVLKNIKVLALGTTYARTIHAQGDIQNISIEGCVIESPDTGIANGDRGNVVFEPSTSSHIKLIDNAIQGGSVGLNYKGGTAGTYRAPGFELRDNEIEGAYAYGVFLQYLTDAVIEGNTVTMRTVPWSQSYSMKLDNVEGAVRVIGNRLSGSIYEGLSVSSGQAAADTPGLVANNWIQNIGNFRTVYLSSNSHLYFYHNSLNAIDDRTGAYPMHYSGGFGNTGNRITNNIFKSNGAVAIYVSNSNALEEMDYNDLYTSGTYLAQLGTSEQFGDLASWQSRWGVDANSLSFDPHFASDTDLTASSPALANAGTPLTEVPTDINGVTRDATPSIGANEIDTNALTPLSGTYTINPSGTGDRNFTTIQSTVEAMEQNGVAGPVIFEIASGVYEEQVHIGDIAGGSESNTVTYESATSNREDVVLQFASQAEATNHVVLLENASDLVFRNLTVKALNTNYAFTFRGVNRLDNILIEGCRMESPDTEVDVVDRGNVRLELSNSSGIRIVGSQIVGGRASLYYSGGGSSYRAPGFELRDNEIEGAYAYGVFLQYLTDAVIEGNTVTMRTVPWSQSYSMKLDNVEGAVRVIGNRLS
ncbi:right-handed parallel beta-helix repeat-containing protein, partial [Algoriphagus limi]